MSERLPTSQDYISQTPPARIIGTETEYSADVVTGYINKSPLGMNNLLDELGLSVQSINHGLGTDAFVRNGARIYVDLHDLLEYATPESLGPFEATATEHAGSAIIADFHKIISPSSALNTWPQRRSGTYQPFEDITKRLATRGYHENFLLPKIYEDKEFQARLTAGILSGHIISRQVWYGAGFVTPSHFLLSQKSIGSDGSTSYLNLGERTHEHSKPLVTIDGNDSTRKNPSNWMMAEIRCADPHMIPYATFMGLATTSLVLRLIEHRKINPDNATDYTFQFSGQSLHDIARLSDNTLGKTYEMVSGNHYSALDIQERFAELAIKLSKEIELPEDENIAAEEWVKLCRDLRRCNVKDNDFAPVLGRVEWATKYTALQRQLAKYAGMSSLDMVVFDYRWTSLGPTSTGLRVAKRLSTSAVWEKHTEHFRTHAPSTRAMARAGLIAAGYDIDGWGISNAPSPDRRMYATVINPYDTSPTFSFSRQ